MKKQIVENHKAIEMVSLFSIIALALAAGIFAYLDSESLILAGVALFASTVTAAFCGSWPHLAVAVKELNNRTFGTMNIESSTILFGMFILGMIAITGGSLSGVLENEIEGIILVIAGLSFIFSSIKKLSTAGTEPVAVVNASVAAGNSITLTNPKRTGWVASPLRSKK